MFVREKNNIILLYPDHGWGVGWGIRVLGAITKFFSKEMNSNTWFSGAFKLYKSNHSIPNIFCVGHQFVLHILANWHQDPKDGVDTYLSPV